MSPGRRGAIARRRVGGLRLALGLGLILGSGPGRPASAQAQGPPSVARPLSPIDAAGVRLGEAIDALDVEHRWHPGRGVDWRTGLLKPGELIQATQAGAFVAAACDHLGVELLHPPEHAATRLAAAQVAWLASEGKARGWRIVGSKVDAQSLANEGFVVIGQFRPQDLTGAGHAAILRPSRRPRASVEADGPDVAMAGRRNANAVPLREAFRADQVQSGAGEVLLFAHDCPATGAGRLDARLAGKVAPGAAAAVAVGMAGAAAVVPGGPRPTLAGVLAAALPLWASAGGMVRKANLQALAADPRIKGERAVALATLLRQFDAKAEKGAFAAADYEAYAARHHLDGRYRELIAKLPEIRRTLFVDGSPRFDRLEQGPIGDCYLISGAGWMARHRPRRIVEMIRPLQNGRFEVHFPSGEHAVVEPPTDTEILYAESNGTLKDGLWMAVIEKAVGTIDARRSPAEHAIADPTIRVGVGGSVRTDVHRWTGHAVDEFELKHADQARKALPALREMERRRLMAQAVVEEMHPPAPIPMNHAYAVLGFDPAAEVVTVWNPWGDDFRPKGPAGIKHGWPRKHGVFAVPFREFVQVFGLLDIERP